MNSFRHSFTVFTPTYNRAHTLERLYRSLQAQSFTDFEWLVIDDGSTDGTYKLFDLWLKEDNPFSMRYLCKENGGKHTAINFGVDQAQGELFFTADSDDYLTEDALQKVADWSATLPSDSNFCGVAGNWGYTPTETPNTIFKGRWRDATLLDRYADVSPEAIDGERAFVFFTDVHKKYKYPVFKNEKFMTEAVAWNRMAKDGYKMRFFNDIIYIYRYLPGGLTMSGNKLFVENPKGYALWLQEKSRFCNYPPMKRLKIYYSYILAERERLRAGQIAVNLRISLITVQILLFGHFVKEKLRGLS